MNSKVIWAIARKDMKGITSNKMVFSGMLIIPIVFCLLFPVGIGIAAHFIDISQDNDILKVVNNITNGLPEGDLKNTLTNLPTINHQIVYMIFNYLFVPLFLLVPIINCSMIAANSFVGEKERRTLESLLFAPIEIKSLFAGKVLASFIPTMFIALISAVMYGAAVTATTYSMFDKLIFPSLNWVVLLLWIVPSFTFLTILFNVWVSARVKTFQEAQQLGGLVVLPIIGMLVSQLSGVMLLNSVTLLILGAIIWIVSFLLLQQLTKWTKRHILFEKQVH